MSETKCPLGHTNTPEVVQLLRLGDIQTTKGMDYGEATLRALVCSECGIVYVPSPDS